jgi:hypothetical protein
MGESVPLRGDGAVSGIVAVDKDSISGVSSGVRWGTRGHLAVAWVSEKGLINSGR